MKKTTVRMLLGILLAFQYLHVQTAYCSAIDVNYRTSIGREVSNAPGNFNYPSGIAVDHVTGDVFVMDELFGRVQRFDADGNYITSWASIGSLGLAVDTSDQSVYVAVLRSNKIRKYDANGQLLIEWGSSGAGPGQFNLPRDVAVHPVTGNVYVADSENRRIQEFTRNGIFVKEWSNNFSNILYGVSTEPTGQFIYLTDTGTRTIYKMDTNGVVVSQWGQLGNNPGDLRWPRGIAVDAVGNVYIASSDNNEIVEFDPNGNYIKTFQGPNNAIDGSFHPRSIDINVSTGDIYVTSSYAYRVDRFFPDGVLNHSWGGLDTTGENFNRPNGVEIDPLTQDIYVADTWNSKIKKFASDGTFLTEYGGLLSLSNLEDAISFPARMALDSSANLWLLNGGTYYPDDPINWSFKYVRQFDSAGGFLTAFEHPDLRANMPGLSIDRIANEIYVSNSRFDKVMVFDFSGNFLRQFGATGSGPGQFISPAGVVVDNSSNSVFVVDFGNSRVQKFDTSGVYLKEFGTAGSGLGQFNFRSNSDISVDDYGHVYVVDSNNSRVQVFDLEGRFKFEVGSSGRGNGTFRFPSSVRVEGNTIAIADTYDFQVELFDIVPLPDADSDDAADSVDNCPVAPNIDQADQDNDAIGDVCDNCLTLSNTSQTDTDSDGIGNICDPDDDNDRLTDIFETGIGSNPLLADSDGDGLSDYAEVAWDGDPLVYTPGLDLSPLLSDSDGDGIADTIDAAPLIFATETIWVEDAVPAGASQLGAWNFVSANPAPFSGALAHKSELAVGIHQQYFTGASNPLSINVGDTMFAYVYLDPTNPPSEVMLQWREGSSWQHRAYWGADNISWGTEGTASRFYMGPLPPAGGWVQMEVPASVVALEGTTVNGMAFTLYDGQASWDYAGKRIVPPLPTLQLNLDNYTVAEDVGTAVLTVTRTGNVSVAASVDYAAVDGTATAGADYTAVAGVLSFDAWESSRTISISVLEDALAEGNESLTVVLSNVVGATLGGVGSSTVNISDNEYSVSGQVVLDGNTPLGGVRFSAVGGGICTSSDANGDYSCTVPEGWSGNIFPALGGYRFDRAWRSYTAVSSNAAAQNYAATTQADTVWVEDAAPTGASQVGTWDFISTNPVPFSGALAHQSILVAGIHQHYFTGASDTLVISTGDTLFTYVYLDPENPPAEIMLQWLEAGSWQHRAYWGTNNLLWGVDGTESRRYMGVLPPAGGWVRLEVPASAVGLEGKTLNGMAFSLYDGRATWDYAGKSGMPAPLPQVQFSVADLVVAEDAGAAVMTVTRTGDISVAVSVDFGTVDGSALAGADYVAAAGTLSFDAWDVGKDVSVSFIDDTLAEGAEALDVVLSNVVGAALGTPVTATLTIVDNDNGVSGAIALGDGTPLAGVKFAATGGGACTDSDASGIYSCAVPIGWSGSITPALGGFGFSPASLTYTNVSTNVQAQNYAATAQLDTVWLDDTVPAGGGQIGSWNFVGVNPAPLSGALAHQSILVDGLHQHYFTGASDTLAIGVGDVLFAYIYLDPANPPSEVMLQWREGASWQHRAYWGADLISWGVTGTDSRRYMGVLPSTGGWVRLEVPADAVGLEGKTLNGMAFTLYDGRATWDYVGKQ